MFTGIVTTLPGVPAVLTPLSNDLAQVSGLPLKSVFMTQVLGFSTTIFPYQAPPILIGMQLAQVKLIEALKVCLYLAVIIDTVEESTQRHRLRWKPAGAEDIGLRCCLLRKAEVCVEELRQIRNSPMCF